MKRMYVFIVAVIFVAFASPVFSQSTSAVAASKMVAAKSAGQINVNSASVKELERLPGIGKVAAERIVAYRTENGKFANAEGLLKVQGVGPKTLEKIRPQISLD